MATPQNYCEKNCLQRALLTSLFLLLWSTQGHTQDPPSPTEAAKENAEVPADSTEPTPVTRAEQPKQRYATDHSEALWIRLFSEQAKNHSLIWLEAQEDKFVGLWQPDTSGKPLGAVLLMHGEGHTPDWPHTMKSLRNNLPEFGWATLSIGLPNPQPKLVPPRSIKVPEPSDKTKTSNESATENNQEDIGNNTATAQEEAKPSIEEKVTVRLKQALQFLNEKGQFNIVLLGEGIGAARALAFIDQLPKPPRETQANAKAKMIAKKPIRAFIMVNARNRIPEQESLLTDHFTDPTLPILDISFSNHYLDEIEIAERKLAAKKKHLKHYNALKIMAPASEIFEGENHLTRRIRGFLDKYAKGVKLDGARIEQSP